MDILFHGVQLGKYTGAPSSQFELQDLDFKGTFLHRDVYRSIGGQPVSKQVAVNHLSLATFSNEFVRRQTYAIQKVNNILNLPFN